MSANLPWWKERTFYQIYPRSFQDSNGDGIGDLRGVLSRLDYLQWLGVGAVWLCPVYDSPNADMGYDIRDYEKIMEEFGSMEDFELLLSELHRRDIKLVMDLVVNHTSEEHPWFVESRSSRDSHYRDYYIWRDGRDGREPNDWASYFTPSAWTYDPATEQWYLHLFSEQQPDLNWENEEVREHVYGMMNRWLDKGVDGFRMDVISHLAKAPGLPDGGNGSGYIFCPERFSFQPRLHDYLREMRRRCFTGRDCMCVGETAFVTTETANSVVGDGQELDLLFQFELMDLDGAETKWDVRPFDLSRFRTVIDAWQKAIDWNTLFWGNHDQPRIVSRFGSTATEEERTASAKMLATALYLLRGTPFIYQGEEIGMTNAPFTEESQLRDVESLNLLKEARRTGREAWAWRGIEAKGRDHSRTPMQWDGTANGGFTSAESWIMVNPNYREINVERAKRDPDSILHYYRALIALRGRTEALLRGDFTLLLPDHPQLFAYRRSWEGQDVVVLCNFSSTPAEIPAALRGRVLLSNQGTVDGALKPYGAVVTALVSKG